MFNLVLFGPPGAGKGTQAEKLIEKYGFNHISTGEVIREQIRKGTELGRSVQSYIEKGQLAPDGLVIDIIADYVAKHKDAKGNIFDGFPRTTVQAKAFDEIMEKNGTPVSVMLSLEVPDEELVKRLLLRGKESGRADDSNEGVIRDRIDVYKAQTAVVAPLQAAGQTPRRKRSRHDRRNFRPSLPGDRIAEQVRTRHHPGLPRSRTEDRAKQQDTATPRDKTTQSESKYISTKNAQPGKLCIFC